MDITGQRYGMLVAIKKVEGTLSQWLFQCDCGNTIMLPVSRVMDSQLSCGCLQKRMRQEWVKKHTTHGDSCTKLYHKYRSMLDRCYRENNHNYKRYGGRGIIVCEEWKSSFEMFKKWAYETGYDPNLDGKTEQSLDRIDNDGDYCPENCKWSTAKEQQKNRECTSLYLYEGELYSASEFADKFNISDKSYVYRRVYNGQSLKQILDDWNILHNTPDNLIDVNKYAQLHNIHPNTVKRHIKDGKLNAIRVGKKLFIVISQ